MYYSIKLDKQNNIISVLSSIKRPLNQIIIEKELFQKIHLPSKALFDNKGQICGVENVVNIKERERIESLKKIQIQIKQYKTRLAETDYQAIKYAEGQMAEEEYYSIREKRQAWRDEINRLENITEEV